MEKDLISIIVPVYNVADYLDDCVKSICQQEYKNVEIILVDDGSTDGSGEKCDAWKAVDERITVIHKPNGGLSSARNAGLNIATGDFIAFVDSDDMVEKSIYVRLLASMKQNGCDIVGCSFKLIQSNGNFIQHNQLGVKEGYLSKGQYISEIFRNGRTRIELAVVWNKLYKRELIEQVRFIEGVVHEDEYFLNDTLFRIDSFYFIPEELYLYRRRDNSIMSESFSEKRLYLYYALRQRLTLCLEDDIEKDCVDFLADKLIDDGIRFWLMLEFFQLIDKKGRQNFYNDVLSDFVKYGRYKKSKKGIMRWMFKYCPVLLAMVYRIHRRMKKKQQV